MEGRGRGGERREGGGAPHTARVPFCRLFVPQPLSEVQKPYRYHGYTPPPSPSAQQSGPFIYSALQHTKKETRANGGGGAGGEGQD